MANQAKYTIAVPTQDNLGNPLRDLASAAHRYLFYGPNKTQGSYVVPGMRGNWRDDPEEVMDHLVTVAEDTPEMDSAIKQLAVNIGELANQWGVFVMKEGKNGVQSWVMNNPHYQDGAPADPAALGSQEPEAQNNVVPFPSTASLRPLEARIGPAMAYLRTTLGSTGIAA